MIWASNNYGNGARPWFHGLIEKVRMVMQVWFFLCFSKQGFGAAFDLLLYWLKIVQD